MEKAPKFSNLEEFSKFFITYIIKLINEFSFNIYQNF